MKNRIITLLSLIMICINVSFAQQFRFYSVSGRVADSETDSALMRCNVALMSLDTTKVVKGCTTLEDGSFKMRYIKEGEYLLRISFVGYHTNYRKLQVNADEKGHKLGTLVLVPTSYMLNEAVVKGVLKEMEINGDTVIYNVDAFKLPEGSMLEDLVKKIPGFTFDEDGTLRHNGKKISKFLIDGKDFFGNDKDMAMKNIPTEMIDKVKTYDQLSDLARITGVDDGEKETVVDLSIKKNMRKGWISNLNVGYGTHDRTADNLAVNRFTDVMQASFIANANNIGRGGGTGVTTRGQAGANIVVALKDIEYGGNVTYNGSDNNTISHSSRQYFVVPSRGGAFSNSFRDSKSVNNDIKGEFKVEWKINPLTTLLFRPRFSVGNSNSRSADESLSSDTDPFMYDGVRNPLDDRSLIPDSTLINGNMAKSYSDSRNYSFSGNLLLNRRIKGNPWFGDGSESGFNGRNVSFRMYGNVAARESNSYNFSNVMYFRRNDSTDITYRYRTTPSRNEEFNAGATYSEPIMRNLRAQLNYVYKYTKRHSDGKTYDFGAINDIGQEMWDQYGQFGNLAPDYENYVSERLSRYTDNINYVHNLELSLYYFTSILELTAGVRAEQQKQKMKYEYQGLDTIASRDFVRFSPTLNARFKFDRQHTLKFTYRGSLQQPNMTDMFSLRDDSNPLNIREGNPGLKPSFSNNMSVDYNHYFAKTRRTLTSRINLNTVANSITQCTQYNAETGGMITHPENIDGNWSVSGNVVFNTPLFNSKVVTVNTNSSASYRNTPGYVYRDRLTLKNIVTQSTLGERMSLILRLGDYDIRANGNVRWTKSESDQVKTNKRNTVDFNYGASSSGKFSNGFSYSTDIGISCRRGYSSANMNTNELIWNAQVSYRILKNKATVTLQAHDILQNRSNISRVLTDQYRSDQETNAINSYYMLSFQYRLNKFGTRSSRREARAARQQYDDNGAGMSSSGHSGERRSSRR